MSLAENSPPTTTADALNKSDVENAADESAPPSSQSGKEPETGDTQEGTTSGNERKGADPVPSKKQEPKITRVPPEEWRRVKKGRKIDLDQSVLIVSSKVNVKASLWKLRQASAMRKKTGESYQAHDKPRQLDVPYRLAINSKYLLEALGECIGERLTETENVFVRPFKYLVGHEADIRQFYSELVSAYEQAEADAQIQAVQAQEAAGNKISTEAQQETPKERADRARRARDEFRCVIEFMDRDMADIFDVKRQISNKTITEIAYENLWQLFRPGQITYHFNDQDDHSRCQALQVLHVTGGREVFDTGKKCLFDPIRDRAWESESEMEERCVDIIKASDHESSSFIIDSFSIDFDGFYMGPKPRRFVIPRYAGAHPVRRLPLYPAFLHPNDSTIQETLLARGKKFTELATGAHKKYDGFTIRESNQTSRGYHNYAIPDTELHSEVMVDQAAGIEHFKHEFPLLYAISLKLGGGIIYSPTKADKRETFDPLPEKQDSNWVTDVFDDSKFESDRHADFLQSVELRSTQEFRRAGCTDEWALLLPARVYGYSLIDHRWLALDINNVSEIPPRSLTSHFEDLVLPAGHKKLLQALVKNHVRLPKQSNSSHETFSMDLVAGKGKGLIILLHGVPGVGKTSTAECVAAELGRPLLPITCGDIGTTAKEAEHTLESFCNLAQRWRCVLLLDEADVFLAKREKGDIQRNSLVSVFLRVLEYYSGVIILTTNRVGEFDEAFRSRIHISLYYPKLSQKSAKEIWQRNMTRLKGSGIDMDVEEEKIERFIDQHWERNKNKPSRRWNGRQMKNAFQTAIALANWDFYEGGDNATLTRPLLQVGHFIRVAQTSAHFDDYIRDIHGFPEEEDPYSIIAGRDELRQDSNLGSFPDSFVPWGSRRRGRNPPVHSASNMDDADRRQNRRRNRADLLTDDEDDDNVKRLKLELRLAELKKNEGSGKAEAAKRNADDDDYDQTW
ncbi:putative ATPase [Cercophora samala]|uniref:ATPase n=1 Tax=Cercophora samala TaxID=330535 RepID=A0AA39ZKB7_9PEZI|nr:putative ATPase [Cercophora samala]